MNERMEVRLEKLFHEPSRMTMMSVLLEAGEGMAFVELKTACGLTDGNLSRHLKTLSEEGAVRIKKSFTENRPRTTVTLTAAGRRDFLAYLDELEAILKRARAAWPQAAVRRGAPAGANPVRV